MSRASTIRCLPTGPFAPYDDDSLIHYKTSLRKPPPNKTRRFDSVPGPVPPGKPSRTQVVTLVSYSCLRQFLYGLGTRTGRGRSPSRARAYCHRNNNELWCERGRVSRRAVAGRRNIHPEAGLEVAATQSACAERMWRREAERSGGSVVPTGPRHDLSADAAPEGSWIALLYIAKPGYGMYV